MKWPWRRRSWWAIQKVDAPLNGRNVYLAESIVGIHKDNQGSKMWSFERRHKSIFFKWNLLICKCCPLNQFLSKNTYQRSGNSSRKPSLLSLHDQTFPSFPPFDTPHALTQCSVSDPHWLPRHPVLFQLLTCVSWEVWTLPSESPRFESQLCYSLVRWISLSLSFLTSKMGSLQYLCHSADIRVIAQGLLLFKRIFSSSPTSHRAHIVLITWFSFTTWFFLRLYFLEQ